MAGSRAARAAAALVRRRSNGSALEIDVLAREAGLHPELVRRLVRLGAVEPIGGTRSAPLFPRDAAAQMARIVRLHRDLGLSYSSAVMTCELLARIDELEARLRRYEPPLRRTSEVRAWIRTD